MFNREEGLEATQPNLGPLSDIEKLVIMENAREEASEAIKRAFFEWMEKKAALTGISLDYLAVPVSQALMMKGHELACCLHRDTSEEEELKAIDALLGWHSRRLSIATKEEG